MCDMKTLILQPNPPLDNVKVFNKDDFVINSTTEPDNGHTKSKLNYELETDRLKTFSNWKSHVVTPEALAKAGFYHLNKPLRPDLVKCAFCKAEICGWEHGDDAFEEHVRWSPNCPFVRQKQNLATPSVTFRSCAQGQDVCGNAEVFPNSVPENETFRLLSRFTQTNSDEKVRLETFKDWPTHLKQTPQTLAEAGFIYLGVDDHTQCFMCKGALRDWSEEDDPWEQHAMWFPECQYVLRKKGREYVNEIKKLRSGVPRASSTKEEEKEEESGQSSSDVFKCKICDSNERNVMLIPCKHIVACDKCAVLMDKCPICRKQIDERMKVFLA